MTGGDGAAAKVNSMMRRIGSASSRKREEGVLTSQRAARVRKSGEDRDEAPPAFGRIQMPMPKPPMPAAPAVARPLTQSGTS